ncbi:serglycin [Toxotes jaculatrix]|uniref:serglycin n=1 Tax=Toxotes jaculatrix TaxID=941984 RepID=UPI001B3A8D45|nr:serglycin [Toxotes jaculatrix]
MKVVLLLVISCLALHNGKGAPSSAVYKFVRCNPEGDQANCVTQQGPEMAWSPDLPAKLPASEAKYLEAKPVEDESPQREEEEEDEMEEEMLSEGGESPMSVQAEEGSGGYEGSAYYGLYVADRPYESETGSGESWTNKDMDQYKAGDMRGPRFSSRVLDGEAKPAEQELRDDHLLQL